MGESIKSKYKPSHPRKYKGNAENIICRSSWERKFCRYCDLNENILEWGSEEFYIPYVSPVDRKVHKYFPDFIIKVRESSGEVKTYVIEVKPKRETAPPTVGKKQRKTLIKESTTYAINQAKWKSAREFCEDKGMEFKIFTEDHINPKYK